MKWNKGVAAERKEKKKKKMGEKGGIVA